MWREKVRNIEIKVKMEEKTLSASISYLLSEISFLRLRTIALFRRTRGLPSERCPLNHTKNLRRRGRHYLSLSSDLLFSLLQSPDARYRKTFWNHIQTNLLGLFQIKPKSGTDPHAGVLSLCIATKLCKKEKLKGKKEKEPTKMQCKRANFTTLMA